MNIRIFKPLSSIFRRSNKLSDYVEALESGDVSKANNILDKLKDINVRAGYNDWDASDGVLHEEGMNPLHCAIFYKQPFCVSHCLHRGMSVHVSCWHGSSLKIAIERSNSEIASLLLDAGADHRVLSNTGRTLIFDSAVNDMYEITARLIDLGVDVNKRDMHGVSAMDRCIDRNKQESAHILRKYGAEYSATNYQAMILMQWPDSLLR